jgi:iron(III) transport system permease protein
VGSGGNGLGDQERTVFTKSKLAVFATIAVLLFGFDYWLFSTIGDSFRRIMRENQAALVTAVSDSLPDSDRDIDAWMQTVRGRYSDLDVLYLRGAPAEAPSLVSPSSEQTELYDLLKTTADFAQAMESLAYQEKYFSPVRVRHGDGVAGLVYVPVLDKKGQQTTGAVLFAVNETGHRSFEQLLATLAVVLYAAVMLILWTSLFSREPIVGYAILLLFLVVGVFVVYPLCEAFRLSLTQNGRVSLGVWTYILEDPKMWTALMNSVGLGIATASLSTAIGFLFAFFTTRTTVSSRVKGAVTTVANLPIISPPFSLTLSLILLFGNNGLVTRYFLGIQTGPIYGLVGLIAVQTITMFSIAFASIAGVLQSIDATVEEASMDLRAGRLRTFLHITLPLSLPGILSGWLLVFTTSIADFANPLLLGGDFRVLSVEAYLEVVGMSRIEHGTVYALMLLLPTLVAFLVQRYWIMRRSYVTVTGKPSTRLYDLSSTGVRLALGAFIGLFLGFIISLYATIVAGCFVRNWGIDYTLTLDNITEAFERGGKSVVDTTTLAVFAAPLAGLLGMMAAYLAVRRSFPGKRLLELLILAPFAIPGTLVGISFVLAFNKPPILLVGTAIILVAAYVIRELPLGLETGSATLRQIDPAIEEAAADLGASAPAIFRTITLPLIRPAFVTTMSFTFVRAMTAVSTIIFLVSPSWYHMTVLVYNFAENMRFGLASVMSTALIIIVLAAFGVIGLLVRQSVTLEKHGTRMG